MTNLHGVLTKKEILNYVSEKKIVFTPGLDQFQIQDHSVDLRIGYSFMVPKSWGITEKGREAFLVEYTDNKSRFEVVELEKGQFFDVLPEESIIATTLEKIKVPENLMGVLYPRSSINRRGLAVDLSGIIDAGYEGNLLIPLKNNTRSQIIRIYPGERFCQIVFYPLQDEVKPSRSRWHMKDIVVGKLPEKRAIEEKLILKGQLNKLKETYKI